MTTGNQYLKDVVFEWNAEKAAVNQRVHGVAFEHAIKAIADAFAIAWIDDRKAYGEERINLLGMCDGALLHVTYTERGQNIRIISARRATRNEQDHYFRENSN
ncbi:MAG: BrnT family toxin [Roseiarcus sp.]|jgi:uncharacterized DUF497 family protein|uniref:BrnT family toxin n=1 Tax=Roseiarcus sp. TaxID=1969460 RepID=UPI003C249C46